MMPRSRLGAHELPELHERLDAMLDEMGVETQPKVALRLVKLAGDPKAEIKDYLEIIQTDWALTGRILRLANSAFCAQRSPVTRLDRALVLIGIERTKAMTLGFYLSRSLMHAGARELTRRVWGQSVYRAALAAALARKESPALASEAHIVGLMLDSGIPLMAKALGEPYIKIVNEHPSPTKLHGYEMEHLEFTHTDMAEALMRRWKMPALLAKPIMWHHTPPSAGSTQDAMTMLHRFAYYAGSVQLIEGAIPDVKHHLPTMAGRLFEMAPGGLESAVRSASREYTATIGLFKPGPGESKDEATEVEDLENLSETISTQLTEMIDEQFSRGVRVEKAGHERLVIDGLAFEIQPNKHGEVVTYISSLSGEKLMSCVLRPQAESVTSIKRLLGLEECEEAEVENLVRVMRGMAA